MRTRASREPAAGCCKANAEKGASNSPQTIVATAQEKEKQFVMARSPDRIGIPRRENRAD